MELALTTAYKREGNGKSERGHAPIVKALVKSCDGKVHDLLRVLSFAIWANRTTYNIVTGYMPAKLMYRQKLVMPIEEVVPT
jgi:hypothetical protein